MTDSEILRLIRESPDIGHRALFDQYYNYVSAIIVRILRDCASPEDTDECIIDVFSDVLEHIGSITNPKSYIGTAARNKALNMRRALLTSSGRTVPLSEDISSGLASGEDIEGKTESAAETERLLAEINALGEPDSIIIIQKYFYDRSTAEITRITGLSAPAVRLRCSRALKKLRKKLSGDT